MTFTVCVRGDNPERNHARRPPSDAHGLDPTLPVYGVQTLQKVLADRSSRRARSACCSRRSRS
jgi:hypothetical protein